jgi:hypothetical protein
MRRPPRLGYDGPPSVRGKFFKDKQQKFNSLPKLYNKIRAKALVIPKYRDTIPIVSSLGSE